MFHGVKDLQEVRITPKCSEIPTHERISAVGERLRLSSTPAAPLDVTAVSTYSNVPISEYALAASTISQERNSIINTALQSGTSEQSRQRVSLKSGI